MVLTPRPMRGGIGRTYKDMRHLDEVIDGFGEGGVEVEVGDRVDAVVKTGTVVEDFTEVVKVLVDEEVLVELELAVPGMHWPGEY